MAMRYEQMTKAELIAELCARDAQARPEEVEACAVEMRVQHAELQAQHEALVEVQRLLESSRDRYADLFNFAPVAYVTLSMGGIVEDINLTGTRLLGVDRSRVVRLPFHAYVVETDRRAFLGFLRSFRAGGQSGSVELCLRAKGRGPIPVQLTCERAATVEPDGVDLRVAITDLSKAKEAEAEREKMLRSEQAARTANEAKDRFLAMLSHELRTPLTPILYAVQALQSMDGLPGPAAEFVEMIRRNTALEVGLIDDLLDVTRIVRGKLTVEQRVVDVHAIVEEVVEICTSDLKAANVELVVGLYAEEHHVRGDRMRLRQVFWNLLRNAIKATPAGGRVTVRSFHEARSGNDAHETITVSVSDTGVGIRTELLERIFLPFEQVGSTDRNAGGLGLGLTIAKGMVEAHGGKIRVLSAGEGRGAAFEVTLTAVAPPQVTVEFFTPSDVRSRPLGMRILVVEDHPDTAMMLSMLLNEQGHQTRVVHSVREARELANEPWDLLLTDLGLPDGSGLDLVRELHERRSLKAIALSGYGREEDVRASKAAGCQWHLTKPIDFHELVETLARVAAE